MRAGCRAERLVEKVEGAEHVAVVGDRHRGHPEPATRLQLRRLFAPSSREYWL
jgi:hypothetical protein